MSGVGKKDAYILTESEHTVLLIRDIDIQHKKPGGRISPPMGGINTIGRQINHIPAFGREGLFSQGKIRASGFDIHNSDILAKGIYISMMGLDRKDGKLHKVNL
jgi:hypothetical protein